MKKVTLILTAAMLLAIFGFTSCSSDNKKNEIEDVDLGLNIGNPKLDNKSGGVYFVSTYAGEYIFRLNLKNGNNLMICEMFHDDKYSDLTAEKRDWEVGENLTLFQFSKDNIQLLISLDQDGEPQSKFLYNDEVWETVAYKSTAKEPVKVYSGVDISNYDFVDNKPKMQYEDIVLMVVINKSYFYGSKSLNYLSDYLYTPELMTFTKYSKTHFTIINPEYPIYPDYANNENTWYREAEYDENKIYSYIYEDDYDGAEYILELFRRFQ